MHLITFSIITSGVKVCNSSKTILQPSDHNNECNGIPNIIIWHLI